MIVSLGMYFSEGVLATVGDRDTLVCLCCRTGVVFGVSACSEREVERDFFDVLLRVGGVTTSSGPTLRSGRTGFAAGIARVDCLCFPSFLSICRLLYLGMSSLLADREGTDFEEGMGDIVFLYSLLTFSAWRL